MYKAQYQNVEEDLRIKKNEELISKRKLEAEMKEALKRQIGSKQSQREEAKLVSQLQIIDHLLMNQPGRDLNCNNCHRSVPKAGLNRVFK